LQRAGYRVHCFSDPVAALAAVRTHPDEVEVVVTDFNMPGLSGVDVANRLAELRPDLPVVISSGFISEDLRAAAHRLHVRAVMQKEHTIEELGSVIHAILHAAQ